MGSSSEARRDAAMFLRFLVQPLSRQKNKALFTALGERYRKFPARDPKQRVLDPLQYFCAAQTVRQLGGRARSSWLKFAAETAATQRRDGNASGSWDPVGIAPGRNSRMLTTVRNGLALQADRLLGATIKRGTRERSGRTRRRRDGRRRSSLLP